MSAFKNSPNFNIYYTDTDSIVIDQELNPKLVGNELGQFKLEHKIRKAVFLAPKVYAFITEEGQVVMKIKGVSQDKLWGIILPFDSNPLRMFDNLLAKDSTQIIDQVKWYKGVLAGEISKEISYQLTATASKRKPIYRIYDNEDYPHLKKLGISNLEIFTNTEPYNYVYFNPLAWPDPYGKKFYKILFNTP